ncbi:hypothetical protein J437_LFUL016133, partial [Ladona fulva]
MEVMFPLIENRNYTRWVTSYLGNLIQAHESVQKELMLYLEPLRNCILESNENIAVNCFPLYLKRLQQTSPKVLQNEEILDKLSHRKKKKGFPFIKGSIFCIFGIIGLVLYDINK